MEEETNYESIIDETYAMSAFREDPVEQNKLNVESTLQKAIQNPLSLNDVEKQLLIDNGKDNFVRGGQTASPVGDILGTVASGAVGYAALKNPITALGVAGAPNPNSPTFMQEFSMDAVMNKGLPLNPIRGAKRIAKAVLPNYESILTDVFSQSMLQKPNFVKQAEEIFSGRLFAITGGSTNPPSGTNKQLQTLFSWETNPNVLNRPQAGYGQTVTITPRKVPRGVSGRMTTRKLNQFTKVETLDLQNGFTPTKQHANFTEYIEDLIEADKIPAQNITPGLFSKLKTGAKTQELGLYEDYLAGYFNTYDTLEGATKVTLGPSSAASGIKYYFPAKDIPKVDRIMKIFKMSPEAFYNDYATGGQITNKKFLQEISGYKSLKDFEIKRFKYQGHHKFIIDDSFALVKNLDAKDTETLRQYMQQIGLKLGNDPDNIQFIPQKLHQKFMHTIIWPEYGPSWTGTSKSARQMQKKIATLSVEDRKPYVRELKEALETINLIADRAVINWAKTRGVTVPTKRMTLGGKIKKPTEAEWDDYMSELVLDDLLESDPSYRVNLSDKLLGNEQDFRTIEEIETDANFGFTDME